MNIKRLVFFFALVLFVTGCDSSSNKNVSSKPSSAGSTLEVVVVSDTDIWKGAIGTTIKDYYGQDQPGLGQPEPMFDIRHIAFNQFDDLFQKHRNLLILDIDKTKEAKSNYKKDVWASPQFVIKLTAPDKSALKKLFEKEKEIIRETFYLAERKRIRNTYSRLDQKDLASKIKDSMNISMIVPEGFYIAKLQKNFVWLRREPAKMSQGIMIYTQPYKSKSQFNADRILDRRDSVTKRFVPGPIDGSYMSTERMYRPYTRDITFNDEYAVEVRGLWDTENYQMGGPFLNITTYDKKNDRLVTMDGFVYHPNKPKRNYLMQLDGVIHSVKFIDEEEQKKEEKEGNKQQKEEASEDIAKE
ncbi:MAG: DUF4837 family protein [Bacteroidales bacterium]|nr:DUF4837 family protein [Bacteroidales bacterium]MCF8326664.1 DUF4837 family protein [Bacteroidales bacterium]